MLESGQWQEIETFLLWFSGWSILDKVLHAGAVVTTVVWLIARAKQSARQREFLSAAVALALASIATLAIYGFETLPILFWFGVTTGAAATSIVAFILFRISRKYSPLADEDVTIMQQRLPVIGVHPCGSPQNLTGDAPFTEFEITLINASVFGITWEAVKGYVCIADEPQEEDTLTLRKMQQFHTQRGKHVSCVVRQKLTLGTAKTIAKREKDVRFDLSRIILCFSFNHREKPRSVEIPVSSRNSYVTWDHANGQMKSAPWD